MSLLTLSVFIVGFLALCLGLYFFQEWRAHRVIRAWRNELGLAVHEPIFDRLYDNINGFELSKISRLNQDALEFTYGEITFESFIALMNLTQPDTNTIFYDLGSGTGKAVLAMAMVFNVEKSSGIELFSSLHEAASHQKLRLLEQGDYRDCAKKIEFVHDNILQHTYPDATLVFIQASTFIGETWDKISQHLEHLPPNAYLISTTKLLASNEFDLIHQTIIELNFGVVEAFIQRRR